MLHSSGRPEMVKRSILERTEGRVLANREQERRLPVASASARGGSPRTSRGSALHAAARARLALQSDIALLVLRRASPSEINCGRRTSVLAPDLQLKRSQDRSVGDNAQRHSGAEVACVNWPSSVLTEVGQPWHLTACDREVLGSREGWSRTECAANQHRQ